MTDTPVIHILFPVTTLKVGDYHPAEFQPVGLQVAVNVPLDDQHVANCADVQITDQPPVTPILTVAGLQWCYNQLSMAIQPLEATTTDESNKDDDDGWE